MCILCNLYEIDYICKNGIHASEGDIYTQENENTFWCIGCPYITTIPVINGLKKIYCYNCPNLETIEKMDTLRHIVLSNCPKMYNLPDLNLTELVLSDMKISDVSNVSTEKLYAFDCWHLTTISYEKLEVLYARDSYNLTVIPNDNILESLTLTKSDIIKLPRFELLTDLHLTKCPFLKKIPFIPTLEVLKCQNNRLITDLSDYRTKSNSIVVLEQSCCPFFKLDVVRQVKYVQKWLKLCFRLT